MYKNRPIFETEEKILCKKVQSKTKIFTHLEQKKNKYVKQTRKQSRDDKRIGVNKRQSSNMAQLGPAKSFLACAMEFFVSFTRAFSCSLAVFTMLGFYFEQETRTVRARLHIKARKSIESGVNKA